MDGDWLKFFIAVSIASWVIGYINGYMYGKRK